MPTAFTHIIVGGGLAGASAVEGIREIDKKSSLLLIGSEKQLPYDRPPLSKKLWFGKKQVEDIFLHPQDFYARMDCTLLLGTTITGLNSKDRTVVDDRGNTFHFEKLLLATGGIPRMLPVPGGNLDGIFYYRSLDDYLRMRSAAVPGSSAVVIGGGFIGSEMAASLTMNKVRVTMIFPDAYLVNRVFPEPLGRSIQRTFEDRGIRLLTPDKPAAITKKGERFRLRAEGGTEIEADIVLVGAGITPSIDLAKSAGLRTGNGILVNEFLQTSDPAIFAAGDNAFFPYAALGTEMRVEHWDNAVSQGKLAGRNMAGAHEAYTHMPYFFSDLFEFGYEAVGEVSTRLDTFADWQKENDTGVIYYLKDRRVRGVMLCNVWEKVEWARTLIRRGEQMTEAALSRLLKAA